MNNNIATIMDEVRRLAEEADAVYAELCTSHESFGERPSALGYAIHLNTMERYRMARAMEWGARQLLQRQEAIDKEEIFWENGGDWTA